MRYYRCPQCGGDSWSRLWKEIVRKKESIYGFHCEYCGRNWFISSKLILNHVIEDQILRIANFTKKTGREFGALIIKNPDEVRLEMVEIGEKHEVSFNQTRELKKGESIVGTWHCVVFPTTLVETDNGRILITRVKVGDKVLASDGLYHTVYDTKRRIYSGKTIQVTIDYIKKGGYCQRISLTPEHLVFVQRSGINSWIRADELTINDYVLVPEYMFSKCEICGKTIEFDKKVCSFSCNGKRIFKLYPEVAKENGERFKKLRKDATFRKKQREGCIRRSKNPEYLENLSKGMKLAIEKGTKIMPEGFRNEETQRKAHKTQSKRSPYWQNRLYNIIKETYPEKDIKVEYEVLGEVFNISNQFKKNCGVKHRQYFLDIALPKEKIDIEVDGRYYHKNRVKEDQKRDKYLKSKGWKICRIPAKKIADGTFWELLSNVLVIPEIVDPPIKFVPRKITKIREGYITKRPVYNLEVEGNPSFIAGRMIIHNCHPTTDLPSNWDIASFLRDDWEKISIVSGAKGTITVMVATSETVKVENVKTWIEKNSSLTLKKKGEKFKFLIFRGKSNNLQLIAGVYESPSVTLEKLLREIV